MLPEGRPTRIHEDHRGIGSPQGVERGRDGFGPQDHPRSPAVRRVVDAAMPPEAPLAEVLETNRRETLLANPARDALAERRLEHRREEREDIDLEGHAGGTSSSPTSWLAAAPGSELAGSAAP